MSQVPFPETCPHSCWMARVYLGMRRLPMRKFSVINSRDLPGCEDESETPGGYLPYEYVL